MKKVLSVFLLFLLTLSLQQAVIADNLEKNAEVALTASSLIVNVGETVTLTAVTPKQGSSYLDFWSGDNLLGEMTEFGEGVYKSTVTFTPQKAGVYTIKYAVYMSAGKGNALFSGFASQTIEVLGKAEVTGITIMDFQVTPINGYYIASGSIYLVWSDMTLTPYSSVSFCFGANETNKKLNVDVYLDGEVKSYPLTVSR